jgi:hypothetical protein
MTDGQREQVLDPAFHEGVVELREDDEVIFSADQKIAAGFKMPRSANALESRIPLESQVTTNKFGADDGGMVAFETHGGAGALDAVKFAWEIVKENKPQSVADGASSAILAAEDMAWNHYAAARPFASKAFTYSFTNLIGVRCVYARYKIRGTCGALYRGDVQTVRPGHYMPSVEVYPESVSVAWGWTLNAGVELSRISDAGPPDGPIDPFFTIRIWFNRATLFSNETESYLFQLLGSKGYLGKG